MSSTSIARTRRGFPGWCWYGSACVFGIALTFFGCRPLSDGEDIVPIDGKVVKVSVRSEAENTGEITVTYHSAKQGQEVTGTGQVTRETEIMINGASAGLKDVREGDVVRGEVRVQKKGGQKKLVVLRIHVDRAG